MEEIRKELAQAAKDCSNFSSLCREYNITRRTGYKWLDRYEKSGEVSDRSRKPLVTANKTPEEIERLIIDERTKHPGWGAKKIKYVLENKDAKMPSVKTVNNILNRYGCI